MSMNDGNELEESQFKQDVKYVKRGTEEVSSKYKQIVEGVAKRAGQAFTSVPSAVRHGVDTLVVKGREFNGKRWKWYDVAHSGDDGWGKENDLIFEKAAALDLRAKSWCSQGFRMMEVYANEDAIKKLLRNLGAGYVASAVNGFKKTQFDANNMQDMLKGMTKDIKNTKRKKDRLDSELKKAIDKYNAAHACLSDSGSKLFNQRERSIDLLDHIESLINSIANHPKDFDTRISEITIDKKKFKEACEYAKEELDAAKKSAAGVGAGVAGGMAVASLAPSAAMWVATTFGTASTGTAISALSGAAAESAALAWLGGGTVVGGGGGTAAGTAFLSLAGPVGWGIAGATLLASIGLFANKKMKLKRKKKKEIEAVLRNTEQLNEFHAKIVSIFEQTVTIRESLSGQYTSCLVFFGKDFHSISKEDRLKLGTLVNNSKALAVLLGEGLEDETDGSR